MYRRFPRYPDDADYQTNAPSYYEDLARKQKLIKMLAKRIWEYDKILADSLEEIEEVLRQVIDKIGEGFNEEIYQLLVKWVEDGTLDHIINETLMNKKADITWVEEQLNLKADKKYLEEELINIINEVNNLLNEQDIKVDNQLKENNERVKDLENYLRTDSMTNEIWSWWMYPQAIFDQSMTFFGSVDNKGMVSVNSFNHMTREHKRTELFQGTADDHNSASVNILDNGRVIVFYCTHNKDSIIRYRVSDEPYDITSLGAEKQVNMNQNITYMQSHVDGSGRVHLFTRRANKGWYYLRSSNNGNDWEIKRTLIITDSGQFYMKIKPRKASDNVDMIRLSFTGHPENSIYQDIYYCYIDLATGQVKLPSAEVIGMLYSGEGVVFELSDLYTVYKTPANKRTRLYDISDNGLNILFCEFEMLDDHGTYKLARWNSSAQNFSIHELVSTGKVIGGGKQRHYYGGGMLIENKKDELVLSREENGKWMIENWKLIGSKWQVTKISESSTKQFRPIIPLNNSKNVMFIKGQYHEDNFTDFNTNIEYIHNIQSDNLTNVNNHGLAITGFSSYRDSEIIIYGKKEYMEQKSLGFLRVPLGEYNNTYRGNLEVKFEVPFNEPPEVYLQGHNYVFNIAVSNITEEGFEINALRIFGEQTPEYVAVRWLAKGK